MEKSPGALPTVPATDTETHGLCNRDPRMTKFPVKDTQKEAQLGLFWDRSWLGDPRPHACPPS